MLGFQKRNDRVGEKRQSEKGIKQKGAKETETWRGSECDGKMFVLARVIDVKYF